MYSQTAKELKDKWSDFMEKQGEQIKELQAEYEAIKHTGTQAEIRAKSKELRKAKEELTLKNKYYKDMVDSTTAKLANTNQIAIAYINGEMPNIYKVNFNDAFKGLLEGLQGISYDLVDEHTVSHLVKTKKLMLPKKQLNRTKDMRWNVKQINSAVLQGILQGESIDDMANRILPIVNSNEKASVRTARTMTTACENKGRMDRIEDMSEQGLDMVKTWLATNDNRTRDSHAELNGETVEIDEEFSNGLMYPADPDGDPEEVYNCRCTMVTKIRGWKNGHKNHR